MVKQVGGRLRALLGSRWIQLTLAVAVLLSAFTLAVGFDPPDADIKYDWLVTREAVRGDGDAYSDVLDLGRAEGVQVAVHVGAGVKEFTGHPRTPGAIVLQLPLVVVPFEMLFAVSVFMTTLAAGFIALFADRDRNSKAALVAVAALLLAAPLWVNYRYAGQAAVIAALVLAGWLLVRDRDRVLGGVLIGVAAVLKLFPAFLIVPLLLARRWKASVSLVATGVILNLAGLALPGVSVESALSQLTVAVDTWVTLPSNGSFVKQFVSAGFSPAVAQLAALGVVSVLFGVLVAQGKLSERRVGIVPFSWLAAGLLVIPLSWISYDLVLAPVFTLAILSEDRRGRLLGMVGIALWLTPTLIWPHRVLLMAPVSVLVRMLVLVVSFRLLDEHPAWSLSSVSERTEAGASLRPSQ